MADRPMDTGAGSSIISKVGLRCWDSTIAERKLKITPACDGVVIIVWQVL